MNLKSWLRQILIASAFIPPTAIASITYSGTESIGDTTVKFFVTTNGQLGLLRSSSIESYVVDINNSYDDYVLTPSNSFQEQFGYTDNVYATANALTFNFNNLAGPAGNVHYWFFGANNQPIQFCIQVSGCYTGAAGFFVRVPNGPYSSETPAIGASGVQTIASVETNQNLQASAISSWANAIQSVTSGPTPTQQLLQVEACLDSNNGCNVDQVAAQNQALTEQRLGAVQNAAVNSEGLIEATAPDPSSPADVITSLLANGKSIIENAVSLIDILSGRSTDPNKQVSISNVAGSGYALTPTSNFYDLTASAQIADDELTNLYVGESFPTTFQLANGQSVYGDGTITSIVDPPGVGTLGLQFQEFTSSAVPEPGDWILLVLGAGVSGGVARLRRRRRLRSSTSELHYRTS